MELLLAAHGGGDDPDAARFFPLLDLVRHKPGHKRLRRLVHVVEDNALPPERAQLGGDRLSLGD